MRERSLTIPLPLVFDHRVSTTAKVIYLVLKSFLKAKSFDRPAVSASVEASPSTSPSIITTHKQITERSGLSLLTVVKALSNLETAGWIERERYSGHPNRYIFTSPL